MTPLVKGYITRRRVVRSEWSKLWSLRSSWYTIAASVGSAYVFAGVVGAAVNFGNAEKIQMDPVLVSMAGLNFAQLLIPVMGIMMMTSEYTTGTIRPTFTAVPHRLWVLWGKVAALMLTVLPIFLVVAFTVFPLSQLFLQGSHLEVSFSAPGTKRALIGAGVSLTLLAILGLGLGALLRSTPAAIGQYIVVLTVIPQAMSILPYAWLRTASGYMPMKASESLMSAKPGTDHASPRDALIALSVWAAVSVIAAGVSLTRRDA
ncbi:ABC transporter permease [Streptomyces sp. 5-10]|uniref:ABC transporter permease n=1 Tax=Streptomyces sp. 5-10 TaxID=878925 RepID=UPI00168AFCC2|nr:ABC transporter permease [Streptomyces sp. 5-10]MBD3004557.1 ABC transporter permease [Streptomyces sp. 5-10]